MGSGESRGRRSENKGGKRREQRREMSKDFWERKRKGTRGEKEREGGGLEGDGRRLGRGRRT
jgi:hypothetical protein